MKVLFEDCVRVKNDLYFICRDYNSVCKMDIETGKIEAITSIPEESAYAWRLGSKIIYWNGFLFFAPMNAKKIWKYDLERGNWNGYERKELDNWTTSRDMFQAVLYKNKIYFIGCLYPAIIVLDLQSDALEYVTKPYENRINLAKEKKDSWFRTDYVHMDKYIYMASCVDNTVFKFNMDTYEFEYIEVGTEDNIYAGLDYNGEEFYLSPRKNGRGVIWNPHNSKIRYLELPYVDEENKAVFGGVICLEDRVVFPACFSNNTMEIQYGIEEQARIINTREQYTFYKKIDDKTIVSLTVDGELEITTLSSKYKYKIEISDFERGKCVGKHMRNNGEDMELQLETEERTLDFFLGMI